MDLEHNSPSSDQLGASVKTTNLSSLRKQWAVEQRRLSQCITECDTIKLVQDGQPIGDIDGHEIRFIGGVDLSFVAGDPRWACAALVVLQYPSLKIVYERYKLVELAAPYMCGFLAFREVPGLLPLLSELRATSPDLVPDVLLVDGNGILHPRGLGLASHLGLLCGIPTIGVAKTFLPVDGMSKADVLRSCRVHLKKAHDTYPLRGRSGRLWGQALRSTGSASNPIFVSVGTGVSLATAVALVCKCCRHRVPEPIRLADLRSRAFLRRRAMGLSITA